MKVIWYNKTISGYEFGNYQEYKTIASKFPNEVLGLERYNDTSDCELQKIVRKLNSAQLQC